MKTAVLLAAILCVGSPALANVAPQMPADRASSSLQQKDLPRLAQYLGCRAYAKANKCKARHDTRSRQCVCVGR